MVVVVVACSADSLSSELLSLLCCLHSCLAAWLLPELLCCSCSAALLLLCRCSGQPVLQTN